jgi:hypothetical protein
VEAVSSELDDAVEPALLAGEVPETERADDVEHWIAVYTELLAGARRLLGIAPDGNGRLDGEVSWLQDRVAFWVGRRAELASAPAEMDGP